MEDETGHQFGFSAEKTACLVADAVLEEEHCPMEAELSLTLTGDEEIRAMNRTYRGMDRVTDVLSFPNLAFDAPGDFSAAAGAAADCMDPETGRLFLGDIVVNVNRVVSQAQEYGHSQLREYAFLIAHSMLHLCGYDHLTGPEAAVMEEKQKHILEGLGITRDLPEEDSDAIVTGEH